MRALLLLGYGEEAQRFFRWQLDAIAPDVPEVHPLYRIDGSADGEEREPDLAGYRGSRPPGPRNAAPRRLRPSARERLPSARRDRPARSGRRPGARAARRLRRRLVAQ